MRNLLAFARCLPLALALAVVSVCARAATPVALPPDALLVLCYHDVVDNVHGSHDRDAVEVGAMVAHFAWLREAGFHPVSLDQVMRARAGGPALPGRPVLLTFDDGYKSFYTKVFPLLRLYRYPALLAIVGSWLDAPAGAQVPYGDERVPRAKFLQWSEVREVARSGLVEIASHTYDLHKGIVANAEGSTEPAVVSRRFDAAAGAYETDAAYEARLKEDLARNSAAIERETGHRPRAMVWPFGAYNMTALAAAQALGMPVAFGLNDGYLAPTASLSTIPRSLMEKNPSLQDLLWSLQGLVQTDGTRAVFVDLDRLYSADPAERERRLSRLVDRMAALKPSVVVLRAWHDADGDGEPDAAYFPTRALPVRADMFNRVAWQLFTRAGVQIHAALPVSSRRLDPQAVRQLYEDLARQAPFHGLFFDGQGAADPAVTGPFVSAAARYRWPLRTFASADMAAVLAAPSGAAELQRLLDRYDLVSLSTPADVRGDAVARILAMASQRPGGSKRVVFRVTVDTPAAAPANSPAASSGSSSASSSVSSPGTSDAAGTAHAAGTGAALHALARGGAGSFGYGPDDAEHDVPPLRDVRPPLSLTDFPG